MWLASVTSLLHTSYCHFLRPSTPQRTPPVCSPTRMFSCTSVCSQTDLQKGQKYSLSLSHVSVREQTCRKDRNTPCHCRLTSLLANRPSERTEILLVIVSCLSVRKQTIRKDRNTPCHCLTSVCSQTDLHASVRKQTCRKGINIPCHCLTSVCSQTDPQKRTAGTEKDDTLLLSSPFTPPAVCLLLNIPGEKDRNTPCYCRLFYPP